MEHLELAALQEDLEMTVHQEVQELQVQVEKVERLVHQEIVELRVVRAPQDLLAHREQVVRLERAEHLVAQVHQAIQELQDLLVHLG